MIGKKTFQQKNETKKLINTLVVNVSIDSTEQLKIKLLSWWV